MIEQDFQLQQSWQLRLPGQTAYSLTFQPGIHREIKTIRCHILQSTIEAAFGSSAFDAHQIQPDQTADSILGKHQVTAKEHGMYCRRPYKAP